MDSSDSDDSSISDGPELNSLDISNDHYYKPISKPLTNRPNDLIKPTATFDVPTYGSDTIRHSLPAYDLWRPFFPTYLSEEKFASFHRPKLRHFKVGPQALFKGKIRRGFPIYNLTRHISLNHWKLRNKVVKAIRSNLKRDDIVDKFLRIHHARDLTAKRGEIFLFEYSEQYPIVLSQYGMAANVKTYIRSSPATSNDKRSLSNSITKNNISSTENNLPTRGDCSASQSSHFHSNVGFVTTIDPDQGSKKQTSKEAKKLKNIYFNDLRIGSKIKVLENNMSRSPIFEHDLASTDFLIIRTRNNFYIRPISALYTVGQMMPLVPIPCPNPNSINKFRADFSNRYLHKLFMDSREDPPVIQLEQLAKLFPDYPHKTLYKRIVNRGSKNVGNGYYTRGEYSAKPNSLKELRQSFTPEQYCIYMSMLATRERLRDLNYTESMIIQSNDADLETEVLAAPWNVSRAVQNAQSGKCYLDFKKHLIDPTGKSREGFSCIAWTKSPTEDQQSQQQKDENLNISRGSIGPVTPLMKNPLFHKVRNEKLARLAIYQNEAQLIAQVQAGSLSSRQVLSSDDESYDSDCNNCDNENSVFDVQLRDLDRLVLEGRTRNDLDHEKEEEERRELMRQLNINTSQEKSDKLEGSLSQNDKKRDPGWLQNKVLKITRTYQTDDGQVERTEIVREPRIIALYVKEKGGLEKWGSTLKETVNQNGWNHSNSRPGDESRRNSFTLGASELCRADGCVVTISKSVLKSNNSRVTRRQSARH